MAAPLPGAVASNGVRTWYAERLADLQAMTTATRGPRGEVPRVNDEGWVWGAAVDGGSGIPSVAAVCICTIITGGSSTWAGKTVTIPGSLDAKVRDVFYGRRQTAGGDERWHLWGAEGDNAAASNNRSTLSCPCDGKVVRYAIRPALTTDSDVEVKFYVNGIQVGVTATVTPVAATIGSVDPSNWVFSKDDYISISTDPAGAENMGNTGLTITIEWDWSTF